MPKKNAAEELEGRILKTGHERNKKSILFNILFNLIYILYNYFIYEAMILFIYWSIYENQENTN